MSVHVRSALLLSLLVVLPFAAGAQEEPDIFARLYYSSWMTGDVKQSPADPYGLYADNEPLRQNPKAEVELIFLGRLGVSYSRQKTHRTFADANGDVPGCDATVSPCVIEENSTQQALNLTLYALEMAHDKFNLFVGGGAGDMDYHYSVNAIRQTQGEVYDGLSMSRWFGGIEYAFSRVGVRLEVSQVRAHKTVDGQTVQVEQTFQYATLIIPLN